tara:strand:+ start:94 stop:720 length:627 start_codon:yes stop_codon:yes gene_type:complete
MELMARYEDNYFDLAIVDPPYGIGFGAFNRTNKSSDGTRVKADKYKNSNWDDGIPDETYFKELFRVSKNQIIWGGNYFPFIWGYGGKGFIYWHKGNPVPNFADGELAWTSFNKVAKQFNYRYYGNLEGNTSASEKHHPTQKPIALYEWFLMNYAKEGDKILDTHLGSGSIALACHNRGFDLTACELDTEYFNAAMKILKEHQQQLTMF